MSSCICFPIDHLCILFSVLYFKGDPFLGGLFQWRNGYAHWSSLAQSRQTLKVFRMTSLNTLKNLPFEISTGYDWRNNNGPQNLSTSLPPAPAREDDLRFYSPARVATASVVLSYELGVRDLGDRVMFAYALLSLGYEDSKLTEPVDVGSGIASNSTQAQRLLRYCWFTTPQHRRGVLGWGGNSEQSGRRSSMSIVFWDRVAVIAGSSENKSWFW